MKLVRGASTKSSRAHSTLLKILVFITIALFFVVNAIFLFNLNSYDFMFNSGKNEMLILNVDMQQVNISSGDLRVVAVMHPDWMGVKHGTESMNIPYFMSSNLNDKNWASSFLNAINNYQTDIVLISGIPPGTTAMAKRITETTNIKVIVVYHGAPALHHSGNMYEAGQFSSMLQAFDDGYIDRIGLVKYEFVETIKGLLNSQRVYPISNFMSNSNSFIIGPVRSKVDAQIHIGIFGSHLERKNVVSQLVAACSLGKHVTVHALNTNKHVDYLKFCPGQIVWHPQLPNAMFKSLASQMDIMLYISLYECQPMVALESLVAKVPVILSDTVSLFGKDAPLLQEFMICPEQDNPDKIRECILKLLNADQEKIQLAMLNYLGIFNLKADQMLVNMLGGHPVRLNTSHKEFSCSSLPHSEIHWYEPSDGVTIKGQTIVFCAYEIGGVTPGGFGTYVDAIIRSLLKEGVNVILLFEFIEKSLVQEWKDNIIKSITFDGSFEIVHLSTLLPDYVLNNSKPTIWWQMAEKWERGLVKLYQSKPFDVVEMHEYVGLSTEIFRRRINGLETLPPKVKIIVRVHGSVTHIGIADNSPYSSDLYVLNLLERFVISAADLVLFPSKSMQIIYEESFGVLPLHASIATLPMDHVRKAIYDDALYDASLKEDVMFWGRVQALKGVYFILDAAINLLESNPKLKTKFHFYGHDKDDTTKKMKALIPPHLENSFFFHGPKSASELPSIVQNYRVAIIASKFETFCYAAHDLHQLRIPLIVPNIPVFQIFSKESTLFFEAGKIKSLQDVMYKALTDDTLIKSMQRAERLVYGTPINGYKAAFSFKKAQHFQYTKEMCNIKLLLDKQLV